MSLQPSTAKMVRVQFLTSIVAPIIAGTLLSVYINGYLDVINFIIVLIIGIGLHVATNVYNDIYDTIQGTDKVNVHRNETSGGSGVLLDNPDELKAGTKFTVLTHVAFSFLLIVGFVIFLV